MHLPKTDIHECNINMEGTLPVLFTVLKDEQVIPIMPKGTSMCPFFLGDRDTLYLKRPVFPLKRGDIALYQRGDGTYIVHRVHHIIKQNQSYSYYFLGDNQTWIEGPIGEKQILGVTSHINLCFSLVNSLFLTFSFSIVKLSKSVSFPLA